MRSQVQSLIRDAYSNEDLLIINSVNEFDTYSCQEWITQGIENGDTLTYPIVDDLVADNYIFSLFVSQLTGGFPYHVVLDHNREVVLSVLGSDIYSVIGAIDDAIEALPDNDISGLDDQIIFYISAPSTGLNNSCYPGIGTFEKPFLKIKDGISAATDGDIISVSDGTYNENIDFLGKSITIGGSGPEVSFIMGDSTSTVTFNSGEDSLSVLSGFTITRSDTINASINGGGIFCENSGPTLTNLEITGNHGAAQGGGIYMYNSGAILNDVDITQNSASSDGGGLYIFFSQPTLNDVEVSDNTSALNGGGFFISSNSNAIMVNTLVSGNDAQEGGGIFTTFGSNLTSTDLTVSGNTAGLGAGIYLRSSESINNNLILGANSSTNGGAIYSYGSNMSIVGGLVYSNTGSEDGGGIYLTNNSIMNLERIVLYNNTSSFGAAVYVNGSDIEITNVTITENTSEIVSTGTGGGIYCNDNANASLENTIIWNNAPDQMAFSPNNYPSSVTVLYSDIDGGTSNIVTNSNGSINWLSGNINQNPMFLNTTSNNYNLQYGSPAIDAGNPESGLDPDGTVPDMGAFYFNSGLLGDVTFASNSFYFITSSSGATYFDIPIINTGNVTLDYTVTVDATIANYTWLSTVSNGHVPVAETEYITVNLEELNNLESGTYTGFLYFGTNTGSNPDIMISNTDTVTITLDLVDNDFSIVDTTAIIESGNIDPILLLNETVLLDFFSSNGGSVTIRSIPSQVPIDQNTQYDDPDGQLTYPIFPNQYFEITETIEGEYWTDVGLSYASLQGIDNPGALRLAKRVNNAGSAVSWTIIPIEETELDTALRMVLALDQTSFSQWSLVSDSSDNSFADRDGPVVDEVFLSPSTPVNGSDLTITAIITDFSGVSNAHLNYASVSDWAYSTELMSVNGDSFSYTIPGQDVTFHGLIYFIITEDQNQYPTVSDTIIMEANFEDGAVTTSNVKDGGFSSIAPQVWRLISLPAIPDDPGLEINLGDELGQEDSLIWRIFSLDDSVYIDNPTDLALGEGYWLYHRLDNNLAFDMSSGRTGNLSGTFISVKSGQWALIGSPYSFAVNIDLDQSLFYGPIAYGLVNEAWTDIVNILQPWSGYAIYNRSDVDQTIFLDPMVGSTAQTAKLDPEHGWRVKIMVTFDQYHDIYNRFGCLETAVDGLDQHDNPEITAPGSAVSLSFVIPEGDDYPLTSDIRALDDQVKIYNAWIRSRDVEGTMTLDWELEQALPADKELKMLDLHSRSVIDMLGQKELDLGTVETRYEHQIKIVYGDPEQVSLAIDDILSLIPQELSLYGNYPNPFNPVTTIRYGLPKPANIRITVVNILGQEIAELVNGWKNLGYHEIKWHGQDQSGRSVASGMYFTILSDNKRTIVNKMLLLK